MNTEEYKELAELFKIFGTPTRLQIMYTLYGGEKCVYDIADELGMSPERDLPSAEHPQTKPACKKPAGGQDHLLFPSGFPCRNNH